MKLIRKDITGKRYGRLLALERAPDRDGKIQWRMLCDCGTIKIVPRNNLCSNIQSCGCLRVETGRRSGRMALRHGETRNGSSSPEYKAWRSMKDRCLNPNHARFDLWGGRGITVCQRWMLFDNFLQDMGHKPSPDLTLDRTDNDGNYEPGNCRWATWRQQRKNQRKLPRTKKKAILI